MPVQFLTPTQVAQYGRYVEEPTPTQLAKYFHLDDTDLSILEVSREDHTKLGFALQLCTARFLGTFVSDLTQTPDAVVHYLAKQLHIAEPSGWQVYAKSKTELRHRQFIRQYYGYEDFLQSQKPFFLLRQLYARAWITAEKPLVLFDFATAWLVQQKVLLPGATILERLIAQLIDRVDKRLWSRLAILVDKSQKKQLVDLLEVEDGRRFSKLEQLRRGEVRASSRTIKTAMQRLEQVRAVGVGEVDLATFPPGRINVLSRYGLSSWAAAINDLGEKHRIATLLVTVCEMEALIQDEIIDLFLMIVTDKFDGAIRDGQKKRLKMLAELDQATFQLYQACQFILNDEVLDEEIRQKIFNHIPRDHLQKAVSLVGRETPTYGPKHYDQLKFSYRSVRLFLAKLLETVTFKSVAGDHAALAAWQFLYQLDYETPKPDVQTAPQAVIQGSDWRRVIFDRQKQIDRRYYTFCALHALMDGLQRRDIFISPSRRWQDQRKQLLHGEAWQKVKSQVCTALGKSADGAEEVARLSEQLDERYRQVAKRMAENKAVTIEKEDDYERIHLNRDRKVPESSRLKQLRAKIYELLPAIDLPDLLLEIHHLTGFADEFTHISEKQAWADDLPLSLCAVLIAEACNVGIDDVVNEKVPALRRSRLLWVKQNYVRDETLTKANARLVAAQSEIPLVNSWGGGEVASADGQRFRVPIQTLYAAPSWKYFGEGRGVTFFTFTSDQFTAFHGVVIPGAIREAMYILDGLLEHQTVLEPAEIMTDTAGYTDMVFGLFWLLGYQFSPRLRDIGKTRFWRMDKTAKYGDLNKIARHFIKEHRLIDNWDDFLRIAGSLKLGYLSASDLMKALQAGKGTSILAKGLTELGRVVKSLYLLNYIDDASYRRRIMIQLLRGERRHSLARAVFHGRKGEVRKEYKDGLEDQLGALGLVVNMIVLWNTLYMNKAVEHLKATGFDVHEDDLKRINPLGHEHIRLTGRYNFTLTAKPEAGGLRPLRQQ